MEENKNTAVDAQFEMLESKPEESTEVKTIDLVLSADVGTISYGDITNLPAYIRTCLKKMIPDCESGVVPADAVTAENYAKAKDVRAELNATNDKLNAERIRIHKLWEQPYEEFVAQFNEKTGLLTAAISSLGTQIKAIETAEKNKKRDTVISAIRKRATDYRVGFDKLLEDHPALWKKVWKDSYANKTQSDTKTEKEYTDALLSIHNDLKVIDAMENRDIVLSSYYRTGNLSTALAEADQFKQTQKREMELQMQSKTTASPVPAPAPTPAPQPATATAPQILQPGKGDIVKVFMVWHKDKNEFIRLVQYMKEHGFHAIPYKLESLQK